MWLAYLFIGGLTVLAVYLGSVAYVYSLWLRTGFA
jgi:hypothetical protein